MRRGASMLAALYAHFSLPTPMFEWRVGRPGETREQRAARRRKDAKRAHRRNKRRFKNAKARR